MVVQQMHDSASQREPEKASVFEAAFAFDPQRPAPELVRSSRAPFLSTLSPGRGQWRAAAAVMVLSMLLFVALAPFAKTPLPAVPAFLPIYQSALVVIDVITMLLLLGQYTILRSRKLLVLACAYLFGALMAMAHALSFPGLFAPAGLLGGGQTTAWLYFLWHIGFPVYVLAYARMSDAPAAHRVGVRTASVEMAVAIGLTVVAAASALALASAMPVVMPLMSGNSDASAKAAVAVFTWLLGLLTLLLLWLKKSHSVIDLWLMVVLCVWAADTALAAVFNNARYDLGWYAGRIFGLAASSFVLAVLLLENSMLYARLVEANEAQRRRSAALQRVSTKLEAANRDLDAFAGALAHDLQQPITTIGAFAQVIERQSGHLIAERQASYLRRIIAAAGMANQMIRSLLEFSRLAQREITAEAVDLNTVFEEARVAVAENTARPVSWNICPLPQVRGDRSLLLLAVINLLSNSVKYSRHSENPRIHVASVQNAEGAHEVAISDNGIGFDMARADRLFRPFERLHNDVVFEGTGMGLANVRRIIERHGGAVRAEGEPQRGAKFTLVFPAFAASPSTAAKGSAQTAPARAAATTWVGLTSLWFAETLVS
jgi:signal transduction histidine kinase